MTERRFALNLLSTLESLIAHRISLGDAEGMIMRAAGEWNDLEVGRAMVKPCD